jgi:hypothetical protein
MRNAALLSGIWIVLGCLHKYTGAFWFFPFDADRFRSVLASCGDSSGTWPRRRLSLSRTVGTVHSDA